MARVLTFAYPGDLNTLTGGYLYDKQIIGALRQQGWEVSCLSLTGQFPNPTPEDLEVALTQLANVSPQSHLVIDGLALGAMGELVSRLNRRDERTTSSSLHSPGGFVALVHHPLALESGISAQQAQHLRQTEAAALRYAAHIIVTSETTRRTVESMFAIDASRITTVLPGTERAPTTPRSITPQAASDTRNGRSTQDKIILLSVGSIIARKGYDVLIQALAGLKHFHWELRIVGDNQRDVLTVTRVNELIAQEQLQDRILLLGSLEPAELQAQYQQADIFALASHYEGYGMAYAEAMQWGLPIIGTTGGAIAETASPLGSILVEPGDPHTLRQAIEQLITQPTRRHHMAQASWHDGQRLPDWHASAQRFAQALELA